MYSSHVVYRRKLNDSINLYNHNNTAKIYLF